MVLGLVVFLAGAASAFEPIHLKSTDFIIATGQPTLLTWPVSTWHVPVWSLSGGTAGQSVVAQTPSLPAGCAGVRI